VFFIVNRTKKHITLPDIKISLGPRQAIDLDRIMDRSESEKSRHLRAASSKGDIEIRVKDGEPLKKIPDTKIEKKEDINKIKDEIIREMKDELKELKSNNGLSKEDLMAVMQQFVENMPTKEVVIRDSQKTSYEEEDVEIDEGLLADINEKTVEKRVKNVEMEPIKYKEENKNNTIINNIEELEGLLE